jgi:serine protease Do
MWSFDEENKNQTTEENNSETENTPSENKNGDAHIPNDSSFGAYNGYSEGNSYYNPYGSSGNNNNRNKKSGLIPAILLCAVLIIGTLMIGYTMGGGKISLGGYGVDTTTTTASADVTTEATTNAQGDVTTETSATTVATTITAPEVTGAVSSATEGKIESVAQKCLNASVLIGVTTSSGSGSGSGVIYTQDGYILTNYHVVGNDTTGIKVTLFSGEEYDAKFVYGDESLDVSVIKIEKNDCSPVELCYDGLNYGEQIIVIGNALGNGFTLTSGYVSAPEREVTFSSTYETMTLVQIDAAVNNGNSGGGLFNTAGQLVGIVNAKLSGTTSAGASIDNIGFAIPISTVLRCVNDLREYGYVTGVARLGVQVQNYIQLGGYQYSGVNVIAGVTPGGSAELAGLKEGDIIYALNGQTIDSFSTLKKMLTAYSVGDTIEITVYRPNENAGKTSNLNFYLRNCDELTLTLTFVEFNPNAQ